MLTRFARATMRATSISIGATADKTAGCRKIFTKAPTLTRSWARHSVRGGAPYRGMFIQTRSTPNAHATMFLPGREVIPARLGGAIDFPSVKAAGKSPLARKLFAVSGVKGVFFGRDFITITKNDEVDWALIRPEIFETLMDFFSVGDQLEVISDYEYESDTIISDDDSEVVAMIKELLETRVKPAVANDGGSIVFRGFEEDSGVVKLEMQGACSTCSSSSITLKNGVENMLKHYIPEVKLVQQVVGKHADEALKASEKAFADVEQKLKDEGLVRS